MAVCARKWGERDGGLLGNTAATGKHNQLAATTTFKTKLVTDPPPAPLITLMLMMLTMLMMLMLTPTLMLRLILTLMLMLMLMPTLMPMVMLVLMLRRRPTQSAAQSATHPTHLQAPPVQDVGLAGLDEQVQQEAELLRAAPEEQQRPTSRV